MEAVAAASAIAGLVSLALEVTAIIHQYTSSVENAPQHVLELVEEVTALSHVLNTLEIFVREEDMKGKGFEQTSVLCSSLHGCRSRMETLKLRLQKIHGSKQLLRVIKLLKWPLGETETMAAIEALHRYAEIFHMSLDIDGW